jgi:hypothetical protein
MKKLIIIALLSTAIASCKKSSTGGDAEVAAFPQHHGAPIYGATIYVKFKAKDLPSDPANNYDLKIIGDPKESHVHIEGLRYGQYFLYSVGYDSTIKQTVAGGIGVKIKWTERKQEIDVNIPVIED